MKPWMAAAISGAPELVTKTFASNASFVMPLGVTSLASVVGEGGDGSPASYQSQTVELLTVQKTGSVSGDVVSRSFMLDVANAAFSSLNGTGTRTASFSKYLFVVDTIDRTFYDASTESYAVRGAATKSYGSSSGNLTYANANSTYFNAIIDVLQPATNGAASTGFGKTFPGGSGGPSSQFSYSNVAVTPGATYSVVVPSGGFITITYYA